MVPGDIDYLNPINWDHPLNQGLVSWSPVLPVTRGGLTWYDLNRRHSSTLTIDPATGWVTDSPVGGWGSLNFGVGEESITSLPNALSWYTNWSVGLWAASTSTDNNQTFLLQGEQNDGLSIAYYFGSIRVIAGVNFTKITLSNSEIVDAGDGIWHHYFVVRDGDDLYLYIDGQVADSGSQASWGTRQKSFLDDSLTFAGNWVGKISEWHFYLSSLSSSQVAALYDLSLRYYPGLLNRIDTASRFFVAGGGGATTMAAGAGTFALSGQGATLKRSLLVAAGSGSFALSGQTANLAVSRKLTASSGSFALSGQTANLTASRKMTADAGSFAVSGQPANLIRSLKVIAANGAYPLSGQQARLTRQLLLGAESGSFALSGQTATLTKSLKLIATAGSFTASGQTADLLRRLRLTAAHGSYALSGQAATLTKTSTTTLAADTGTYALSGQSADLLRSIVMAATQGTYTLSGQAATLSKPSASGDIVMLDLADGSIYIASLGV